MEAPIPPKPALAKPTPTKPGQDKSGFPSLDGLTDIGFRGGADMRPTLIRVLTDLYVQKPSHTPEEERHYTELALRLLDAVDAPTRTAVATRLAPHLSPPPRVVQYLLNDLPEVSAPLRTHALLNPRISAHRQFVHPPNAAIAATSARLASKNEADRSVSLAAEGIATKPFSGTRIPGSASAAGSSAEVRTATGPRLIEAAIADDLNEQFFAATAEERRLILLNMHVAAPLPPGRIVLPRDPSVRQRLEAAALGSYREELVKQLAQALLISRLQARRIARDSLGEPIAVATKALGIPRDAVYRILMFINPAVGHSIERVHALTTLFDDMTLPAAEGMVAIWQSLSNNDMGTAKYRPLHFNDEPMRARPEMARAAHRQPPAPKLIDRRNVS